jgi:hypothetical protein
MPAQARERVVLEVTQLPRDQADSAQRAVSNHHRVGRVCQRAREEDGQICCFVFPVSHPPPEVQTKTRALL